MPSLPSPFAAELPWLDARRRDLIRHLSPPFTMVLHDVLARSAAAGFQFVPYAGLRSPQVQARFWRQSRAITEIKATCSRLRDAGAPTLARMLEGVGPQAGRWATNALPGQSAHQYGLAVDCFLLNQDGSANWDADHSGYLCLAETAEACGLKAGLRFGDPVHIEAAVRPWDNPGDNPGDNAGHDPNNDPNNWPAIERALHAEGWL